MESGLTTHKLSEELDQQRGSRQALPARGQTTGHGQLGFPAIETDGLAQQQPSHHPGKQHQMTMVADPRAVLTQKAGELTVEPGMGIHEGLVWCDDPNLSWLPAHPIS